ncbi:hypothetical protein [Nocardia bovistercoris]|uniref:Uncharacterized protein n=1 Tax=Nocardia bovistercoris TaxID=2785916 RepID=A0A931II55_9NOCA|nr:hypothetical protein [Nocardia bovistercoris]MBH0781871.1 hypothetical protein [Nocardia bovistercoris]
MVEPITTAIFFALKALAGSAAHGAATATASHAATTVAASVGKGLYVAAHSPGVAHTIATHAVSAYQAGGALQAAEVVGGLTAGTGVVYGVAQKADKMLNGARTGDYGTAARNGRSIAKTAGRYLAY